MEANTAKDAVGLAPAKLAQPETQFINRKGANISNDIRAQIIETLTATPIRTPTIAPALRNVCYPQTIRGASRSARLSVKE